MSSTDADIRKVRLVDPSQSGASIRPDESLVIDNSNAQKQRQIFERFGRTYRAGEFVFKEGDIGREMFIIQEGQVKLIKKIRGERRVIETVGAGDFFGEMAILNSRPRSLTAEAASDVKLLIFPPETFEALVVSNTGLAHRIIRTLAGRLQNADNHIENLLYLDVESKLVNALLKLLDTTGIPEKGGIRLDLTPTELAEKVSLTADQVKRVMLELGKNGVIQIQKKALLVPDTAKLEKALTYLDMRAELQFAKSQKEPL